MTNKIYSFLGLATKAGKLLSGEETCERAVKSEKVCLVIVAADAANNTKKKFGDMCKYRGIQIRFFGEKELIGRYIGKKIRSVVAFSEIGFAKRIIEILDDTDLEDGGMDIGKS